MNDNNYKTAQRFHILERLNKLETDLMEIIGVVSVEFDLDGFYDDLNQVIFLTKYDIPVSDKTYFVKRKALKDAIIETANRNGLVRTEDKVEDYGEHFYFVFDSSNWNKEKSEV